MFKKFIQLSLFLIAVLAFEGTLKTVEAGRCQELKAECKNRDCHSFNKSYTNCDNAQSKMVIPHKDDLCEYAAKEELNISTRKECN